MGASKLNTKQISTISAADVNINDFELFNDMVCSYVVNQPLDQGEMILIKASFKNACESDTEADDQVLYRRRVVPFVTRVTEANPNREKRSIRVSARIESITDEDRHFFYKKYFESTEERDPLSLEIEGKHIQLSLM